MSSPSAVEKVEADLVAEFNRLVEEMTTRMMRVLKPWATKLKEGHNAFLASKKMSLALPITHFWKHAQEHGDALCQPDKAEAKEYLASHAQELGVYEGVDLTEAWKSLNDASQDALLQYTRALFDVAKAYFDKDAVAALATQQSAPVPTPADLAHMVPADQVDEVKAAMRMLETTRPEELPDEFKRASALVDQFVAENGHLPQGQSDLRKLFDMGKNAAAAAAGKQV